MDLHVNVHHSIQIVEMENVNITSSVETVSAIMVKLSQHAHKNARNVVGMVCVVQWKPVIIVLEIVALVKLKMYVEMGSAQAQRIVHHVRMIVARIIQQNTVGMANVLE